MRGYNLPDNVDVNDPEAPWNLEESDEDDQEHNCGNCLYADESVCYDCFGENFGHVTEISNGGFCLNWKEIYD